MSGGLGDELIAFAGDGENEIGGQLVAADVFVESGGVELDLGAFFGEFGDTAVSNQFKTSNNGINIRVYEVGQDYYEGAIFRNPKEEGREAVDAASVRMGDLLAFFADTPAVGIIVLFWGPHLFAAGFGEDLAGGKGAIPFMEVPGGGDHSASDTWDAHVDVLSICWTAAPGMIAAGTFGDESGVVVGAGIAHAGRNEQSLVHESFPLLTTCLLDDLAKHYVAGVGVLPFGSRVEIHGAVLDGLDLFFVF